MTISTSKFEMSQGRSPKGRGHWGFIPVDSWNAPNYTDFVFWFSGKYGDAKKAAVAHFAAKGETYIMVCP